MPIKILASVFKDIKELILHFIRKGKGARTAKTLKSPWAGRQAGAERKVGDYPAWLPRGAVLGRLPPTLLESHFLRHKLRKHTGPTVYLGRQLELRNDATPLLRTTSSTT